MALDPIQIEEVPVPLLEVRDGVDHARVGAGHRACSSPGRALAGRRPVRRSRSGARSPTSSPSPTVRRSTRRSSPVRPGGPAIAGPAPVTSRCASLGPPSRPVTLTIVDADDAQLVGIQDLRTERRLAAVIDAVADSTLLLDADGRLLWQSDALAARVPGGRANLGSHPVERLHPEDLPARARELRRAGQPPDRAGQPGRAVPGGRRRRRLAADRADRRRSARSSRPRRRRRAGAQPRRGRRARVGGPHRRAAAVAGRGRADRHPADEPRPRRSSTPTGPSRELLALADGDDASRLAGTGRGVAPGPRSTPDRRRSGRRPSRSPPPRRSPARTGRRTGSGCGSRRTSAPAARWSGSSPPSRT